MSHCMNVEGKLKYSLTIFPVFVTEVLGRDCSKLIILQTDDFISVKQRVIISKVLTVFLPAAGPELVHPHLVVSGLAGLHGDGGRHLDLAPGGDLLRGVVIPPHKRRGRRQPRSRPPGLNPASERLLGLPVTSGLRLIAAREVDVLNVSGQGPDLTRLRAPRHRVLPDALLLTPPLTSAVTSTLGHVIKSVLSVSLPLLPV